MKTVLITGASGEIGHTLIEKLNERGADVATLDLTQLNPKIKDKVSEHIIGDILDTDLLASIFEKYNFDTIFHLAAMLSTSAEHDPVAAHHVNTDGSINLLSIAEKKSRLQKQKVTFMFPSSIAIYGMPDIDAKRKAGKVNEEQFNKPATMYGCNKLYVELLGNYYSRYFEKDENSPKGYLDFRAIRFPGLISADTMPTGGTSDFGPEIMHAAAQNKEYSCFVREDSKLPFMVMPDAVKGLIMLAEADANKLGSYVYNIGSFSISAGEITGVAKDNFGNVNVSYKPDQKRQAIVDSWPEDIDDNKAKGDWGWRPDYDKETSFTKYLVPAIKNMYN